MLYVSRFVGRDGVGIVDTDDNIETVVQHNTLLKYVCELRLDIKGVEVEFQRFLGKDEPMVISVGTYQLTSTPKATKLRVMSGVDLHIFKGALVELCLDKDFRPNTVVRLSDYCTKIGDRIFSDLKYSRTPNIILIIDDKLQLAEFSLVEFYHRGVVLDMRGVKNRKMVSYICGELVRSGDDIENTCSFVIDSQLRMDFYRASCLLHNDRVRVANITHVRDIVKDPVKVTNIITQKYRVEFIRLAATKLKISTKGVWIGSAEASRALYLAIKNPNCVVNIHPDDYDAIRNSEFISVFDVLWELTDYSEVVIRRFKNYILYFDVTKELKMAFLRLVHHVCVIC